MTQINAGHRNHLAAALVLGAVIGALIYALVIGVMDQSTNSNADSVGCASSKPARGIGVPLSDPDGNNRVTFDLKLEDLNCEGDFFLLVLPAGTQPVTAAAVDITSSKSGDTIGTLLTTPGSGYALVALTDFVETRVGTVSGYIDLETIEPNA